MTWVEIDIATGTVVGVLTYTGEAGPIAPPAGRTRIDVTGQVAPPGGWAVMRWDGVAFVPVVPAPVRVITREVFYDRWTDAEREKLEQLSEANTVAGRRVRVFLRAVAIAGAVNLDKAKLARDLAALAGLMISDGIWANQAAADVRIAALLANG